MIPCIGMLAEAALLQAWIDDARGVPRGVEGLVCAIIAGHVEESIEFIIWSSITLIRELRVVPVGGVLLAVESVHFIKFVLLVGNNASVGC